MNENEDIKIEKDENIDVSVIAEEVSLETIKILKEKLKKANEEKQAHLDGWMRDKAEFINARKRDEEAQKDFARFSNESLISELIPVLDSFNIAMSNKEAWEKADKNWRTGVEYIYGQLSKVLQEFGLKEINPIGQSFNPMRDEAIEHEGEGGIVTEVVQKGYELHGKVLKAPKVKVGDGK